MTDGKTPVKVYELALADVLITTVGRLDDFYDVTFDYSKIGLTTRGQKPDGKFAAEREFGWDLLANKAIDPDNLPVPTVDVTPPGAPTLGFSSLAPSGPAAAAVSLTGTAEPLSKVYLYDGPDLIANAFAGGGGKYNFADIDLATGAHTLRTVAVDAAFNASPLSTATSVRVGSAGNDTMPAVAAAQILAGLGGNDTYNVGAGDIVFEAAGGGSDRVIASVSHVLRDGSAVEVLRTNNPAGVAIINLTGNQLAQTIQGNAGANILDGGGGNDVLQGLGGNDTYRVDGSGDKVFENVGGGNDRVLASASYALRAASEVELLRTSNAAGVTAINLVGNEFGQTLQGNAGNNRLDGRGGNDVLQGLAGNDTFVFAENFGSDTVSDYQPGSDRFDLRGVDGLNSYADVQALMNQVGAHVVIDFGGGDLLKILNTTIGTLNANQGDFLL
jgi:Ca2+-binding RTX toxin-like protein